MKEWIGKRAKLLFNVNSRYLTFDAVIMDITDEMITFLDKYQQVYSFDRKFLVEIKGEILKGGSKNGL